MSMRDVDVTVRMSFDGDVSVAGESRLKDAVQRFGDDLAAKVREVEKAERALRVVNPEVTASTAVKAEEELKERSFRPKPSRMEIGMRLVAPVASGAAGILGSYLNSPWQYVLFGGTAVLAVVTTLAVVLKGITW